MEIQRKRQKVLQEKADIISGLPDELIQHILSFLPSPKEAVQTGILSKRWLNQWTHVPALIFDGDSIEAFAICIRLKNTKEGVSMEKKGNATSFFKLTHYMHKALKPSNIEFSTLFVSPSPPYTSPIIVHPVATTRKSGIHVERQNSEMSYYTDDEDGNSKKYGRGGE